MPSSYYIDDLLCVWGHNVLPLQLFLDYIKENDLNLKFTGTWNKDCVDFLDIRLRGDKESGKVVSSLYRKTLPGNTILRANSCHPKHTILAILRREYTRARKACRKEGGLQA